MIAAVAGVCFLVTATGTAQAEPSVSEIEKQIDDAWNKLEPVIEQHNATRSELKTKQKRADALRKRIEPLQLQIELSMARVGDVAAYYYKGGSASTLNALLTSGSPSTLAEQLGVLDLFARNQQEKIQNVVELKARYDAEKLPLDQLVADLTRTEKELATKETQINAEIKRLQALRTKVYGSSGALGSLRPVPCPVSYPGGKAGIAVKFACAQIGKPYVWGAAGPNSYDCSGLTMVAWEKAGVYLPHNAAAQRRAIPYVSRANLRPGDLVFYYSDLHHVGMYVGGGWIVHASQPGVPIKMRKVDAAPVHSFGRPG